MTTAVPAPAEIPPENGKAPADASPELDFAKYRRPELAEQIASLISLPKTLGTILRCGGVTLVVVTCPPGRYQRLS